MSRVPRFAPYHDHPPCFRIRWRVRALGRDIGPGAGEGTPEGGAQGVHAARARPVAPDPDRLIDVVAAEVPGLEISKDQRRSLVAWLPSNDEGALPSSPMLTEQPLCRAMSGSLPGKSRPLA